MWASTALEGFQRAEKNQLFHLTSNVLCYASGLDFFVFCFAYLQGVWLKMTSHYAKRHVSG